MRLRRLLPAIVVSCGVAALPGLAAAGRQTADGRARAAYDRAVELEGRGDHTAALSLLWEAAGLAPGDADVQNRLGEALERIGALDAAVDAYRRAIASRPGFRKAEDNLILTLVKGGRGVEAVERARARVAAAPEDPHGHFTLGLAQADQDVEGAIRSFQRTLELAPRHTLARYNLALVLKRADRLEEAADELERSLAIEPRPEAHYTLGVVHWHQGDLKSAAASLRAAVAAEPAYADAHYTLGAVLKDQGDLKAAAASLRRAIALEPALTGAHYTLAGVLQAGGDGDAARAELAEAERLRQRAEKEHEASVWTSVGTERLDAGDLATAAEHFRRATTTFEGYAPAHYQLGRTLRLMGQMEAARQAFARARELNPNLVPPPDPLTKK